MGKCSCGTQIADNYIMCFDCHNKKQQFEQLTNWLKSLTTAWKNKDIDLIVTLFDKDAVVYDTPFSNGTSTELAWRDIATDNFTDITYSLLSRNDKECFVEFKIIYPSEVCSAINHIKFNTENKCIYIKQWFMINN